jgi:hypothetical protein
LLELPTLGTVTELHASGTDAPAGTDITTRAETTMAVNEEPTNNTLIMVDARVREHRPPRRFKLHPVVD